MLETDFGLHEFLLGTGTTITTVQPQEKKELDEGQPIRTTRSKKFCLGGIDLGPRDVVVLDTDNGLMPVEGILGADLFDDYVVYIDQENKKLFLKPLPKILDPGKELEI